MKNQFGVRSNPATASPCLLDFLPQLVAGIEPRVGRNPKMPIETRRLPFIVLFMQRLARGSQHRMPESDRPIAPRVAAIGTAVREKMRQAPKKSPWHRCALTIEDAGNCAQFVCVSIEDSECSNGIKCRCSVPP